MSRAWCLVVGFAIVFAETASAQMAVERLLDAAGAVVIARDASVDAELAEVVKGHVSVHGACLVELKSELIVPEGGHVHSGALAKTLLDSDIGLIVLTKTDGVDGLEFEADALVSNRVAVVDVGSL